MTATTSDTHRLTATEKETLERDGYVVRTDVFGAPEVEAMVAASEDMVARIVAGRRGTRFTMGSYVFEPDALATAMLKWEGDSDVLHGVEPFAHLSDDLAGWGRDPRLVEPMEDLVDDVRPELFTEKLNLKRAHHGGPNPLHQDYPYWVDPADDASRVATAIVYLDDATAANGCLEVVPGSHRADGLVMRSDADAFGAYELDPDANAHLERVRVEVPAGSVVYFGPFLAHATGPNRTDRDRRALLYSYQPAGGTHMLDSLRKLLTDR